MTRFKVIPTYDVTHHIALMLKQELEVGGRYQEFCQKCYQCRQEIQQTEMLFLRPPAARSKARYFNLEPLIKWGNKIKIYEEKSVAIAWGKREPVKIQRLCLIFSPFFGFKVNTPACRVGNIKKVMILINNLHSCPPKPIIY
jgi:hypothetical protein